MNKVVEYKKVVRQSWIIIESVIDKLNIIFHEKLNELDKSTENIFSDNILIEQNAAPFLTIVSTAVSKLDDLDSLVPILQAQGKLQRKIGAKPKQYDTLGAAFLYALEQSLDTVWNKSVKEAWTWIYVFIAKVMQPPEDDETKKRNAVRRTWAIMEKIYEPFSNLLFKTLLESDASIAAAFQNIDLTIYKPIVITSITQLIASLDEKDKFVLKIQDLAVNNMPKAMEMKHYKLFGDAFLRTLMAALGQEFTAEVRDSWTWFYSFVAKSMIFEIEEMQKRGPIAPAVVEVKEMPSLNRIATEALPTAKTTNTVAPPEETVKEAPVKKEVSKELLAKIGPGRGFSITVVSESGKKELAVIPPASKPAAVEIVLTQEAKIKIIQDSWAIAAPKAHEVLSYFFDTLFDIDPEIKPLFANTDMMLQRIQLSDMLTQAVGMLNNLDSLLPILASLGKRHIRYGVLEEHYTHFGTAFMETLSQAFGVGFTYDMKTSWHWLTMKGDLYKSKELTTEQKIRLIQDSWANAKSSTGRILDVFYSKLFELDASIPPLFSGLDMAAQKSTVAATITKAVSTLNQLDELLPILRQLGVSHISHGVKDFHYDAFATAFIDSLANVLGADFTADLKTSWTWAVNIIATNMKADLYKEPIVEAPKSKLPEPAVVINVIKTEGPKKNETPLVIKIEETKPKVEESKPIVEVPKIQVTETPVSKPEFKSNIDLSYDDKVKILQSSWASALPNSNAIISFFYKRLFVVDAEVAGLFIGTDMQKQHSSVLDAVTSVIGLLNTPSELKKVLSELGQRHIAYGVKESHYTAFTIAFTDALSNAFGDAFTSDLKRSWNWALDFICVTMKGDLYKTFNKPVNAMAGRGTITINADDLERIITSAVSTAVQAVFQSPQFAQMYQPMYPPYYPPYGMPPPPRYQYAGYDDPYRSPSPAPSSHKSPSFDPQIERSVAAVAAKLANREINESTEQSSQQQNTGRDFNALPPQHQQQHYGYPAPLDYGYRAFSPAPFPSQHYSR